MICSTLIFSVKGFTMNNVTNAKIMPNVIEIGKAGNAFLVIASKSNVKQRPMRIATKQANVVFQSP